METSSHNAAQLPAAPGAAPSAGPALKWPVASEFARVMYARTWRRRAGEREIRWADTNISVQIAEPTALATLGKRGAAGKGSRANPQRKVRRKRIVRRFAACLGILGFAERTRGNHHMFSRSGVEELINLQREGAKAKSYQVKQVRAIILKYKLGES